MPGGWPPWIVARPAATMPGMAVARELAQQVPEVAVVLVSTHDAGDYRELAVAHGARGFITKAELSGGVLDAFLRR